MAANKVVFDGKTVIDLTNDTVSEDAVFQCATFHAANGDVKTGTFTIAKELTDQDFVIEQIKTALQGKAAGVDLSAELSEQDSLIEQIRTALLAKMGA